MCAKRVETPTTRPEGIEWRQERMRDDFWWAYEKMGGREVLFRWGLDNMKEFVKVFIGLFPREQKGDEAAASLVGALREVAGEDE